MLIGRSNGHIRDDRPQRHDRCPRAGSIRTVSFQPSSFPSGGRIVTVPRRAVEQLHVVEVEVDRVRVHAVVRDLPDLRPVVADEIGVTWTPPPTGSEVPLMSSVGGLLYGYRMMFWSSGVAPGASSPRLAVMRPFLVEGGRVRLVVDRLGLQRNRRFAHRVRQRVEPEQVAALLEDPREAVAAVGRIRRVVAPPGAGEVRAVGPVVGSDAGRADLCSGLPDDDGVLRLFEDPPPPIDVEANASSSAATLKAGPGLPAIFTCITVRVFGP